MKRILSAIVVMSSVTLLSSCATDSVGSNSYGGYRPGYTGYTVSVGDYPSNGYGPSFWTPGYYNSMGYNGVYGTGAYYRGYRTGAYGYHGGYHGVYHGYRGYNHHAWYHRR